MDDSIHVEITPDMIYIATENSSRARYNFGNIAFNDIENRKSRIIEAFSNYVRNYYRGN